MTEYTSLITIVFSINNLEADSVEDYKQRLKENFKEDFNIELTDDEITNIEPLEDDVNLDDYYIPSPHDEDDTQQRQDLPLP